MDALQAQGRMVGMVGAVELSRATLRKMHQNLFWAVSYDVIAFPLAARVFYHVLLSPEVAALAMSGSSALVAIAALLLGSAGATGRRPTVHHRIVRQRARKLRDALEELSPTFVKRHDGAARTRHLSADTAPVPRRGQR